MAKTIEKIESVATVWWKAAVFGALICVATWLLGLMLTHVVVQPLACGITGSSQNCSQSGSIGGDIATILITVAAFFGAFRAGIARPVFTILAAGVMLWGLSGWVNGLGWLEALVWSLVIGALAVSLFAWINRTQSMALAIIIIVVILIAERIALA